MGWFALIAAVILTLVGVEAIRTIDPHNATKQMVWWVVALIVAGACILPRPRLVGLSSYGLLFATLGLLVLLVLPGVPDRVVHPINSTRSWIDLQFMYLQPSELAKIAFVLAMAWYLRHRRSYRTMGGLLVPFAIMLVPVALILRQPDLGTAMLFAPTLVVMLIAAGARLGHIGTLVATGILIVALTVTAIYAAPRAAGYVLRPHQQDRFKALISQITGDPKYDDTVNYQPRKAKVLVGAGRFWGQGAVRAHTLITVHRLPEAHNDMIFAVIVNRWGLRGGLLVLMLYTLMVVCFALIAGRSRDPFTRLAMVGFGGLLFTQAAMNIAVNVGLFPVTGITLPFVSYGGSSLVTMFAMIGLSINFASYKTKRPMRPTFEFHAPEPRGESRVRSPESGVAGAGVPFTRG